ncbi:hypothetical protein [Natrononativus amylolyticus]|uniref:hypothetical protein n=1 Tax=Natrononativus amylolyticus TaxID=2963434 RepID=UPI0020CDFA59|nr:hypothetical protein [Natrononativus amylolyticus]
MDINITFQHGPIEAEIKANEEDDYEEVLKALKNITEDYPPADPLPNTDENLEEVDQQETDVGKEEADDQKGVEQDFHEQEALDGFTNRVSSLNDLSEQKLYRLVKAGRVEDGEIKEHPRYIGDNDLLGDNGQHRLLNASILLLTVLDDFHGIKKMKTSELKQALADSGLNEDNWRNVGRVEEEDIYLNRRGKGPSATTEIRPPGKDEAYQLFTDLASEIKI